MDKFVGRGILVVALLVAGGTSLHALTTMETFDGSGTLAVSLPGSVGGGGTTYGADMTLSSLSASGAGGSFTNSALDTTSQASVLPGWNYSGHFFIPATSGPATVTVTGAADVKDGSVKVAHISSITVPSVSLSSTFASSNIAVSSTSASVAAAQMNHQTTCSANKYSSTTSISTQVSTLSSAYSSSLTSIDSVNGLIDFTGSGSISTTDSAGSFFYRFGPAGGLGLMLLSLLGIAALRLRVARRGLVLQPAA